VPGPVGLKLPAVLREREYALLWSGQTVSVFGDAMLLLALSFAVLDLTGSVTDIGLVLAASRAPLVLTVLAGGVVADWVSRRWLMVVADVVRAAALVLTAALLIAGTAKVWQLLVLQAVVGTASGFFYPAATGLLPLTVPFELLQGAKRSARSRTPSPGSPARSLQGSSWSPPLPAGQWPRMPRASR
jgi:MFS family permease